jgi:hypothetical protein
MNRARLAMAYQACEVADLAAAAVSIDDPAEALAQAERVLAAADRLLGAATRLTEPAVPTDPLQLFAYEHPDEAAADVSDWLRRCRSPADQEDLPAGVHAHGGGRDRSRSTRW